ncbi:hypothetical protein MXB_3485 [Myxobolus squamalis]|nr:hypothetical protein MXB_3485 [Myxobolus squamalis]
MDSKSQDMDMLIELCNQRNKAATMVEKDSNLYNLWLFIRTHGSLTCKGIIIPGVDVLFSNKKAPPRVLIHH